MNQNTSALTERSSLANRFTDAHKRAHPEPVLPVVCLKSPLTGFSGEAVAVGVNTKKSGADPELKPVFDIPPWVAELAAPQETMFDLRKKMASLGQESLKFQEVR